MNWITGIQRAINYIEDHVEDDIDIAAAAREAASPPFHFQRMFSMLTGITLGDYIRMRRLSLAADELRRGNEKTIDIALRFGYDTPESFSRAFQRFHGITPTEARHGGNVRSFSRLSVKLTLYGGNLMDYRIEKRDAFSIICKRKHVNKPEGTSAEADIAPLLGGMRRRRYYRKTSEIRKLRHPARHSRHLLFGRDGRFELSLRHRRGVQRCSGDRRGL